MIELAYTRSGQGESLVLLHGIGSSRAAWAPVLPALGSHFDVLAVDLPGFGESAVLPADIEPIPAALAGMVAALLDELEITDPHLVGNSLGGWVALELAKIRSARSVTLLSPAGFWRRHTPFYCRTSLRLTRLLAKRSARLLNYVLRLRAGRALVLGQSHGHPIRTTVEHARAAVQTMGNCPGFEATLRATLKRRYVSGPAFEAPVTVAFGSRDLVLLKHQSRHLDELPPDTRAVSLRGCGHVPMSDDPAAVASVIRQSAARATRNRTQTARPVLPSR